MMIRYADGFWINGAGVYFWILEDINDTLIDLISLEENNVEMIEQIFFKLSVEINRIIPVHINKKTNELILTKSDGILSLKEHFDFLMNNYNDLFEFNKKLLELIHDVRNKYNHNPHYINWHSYIGNNTSKKMIFVNWKYDPTILSKLDREEKFKIDNGIIRLKWEIRTEEIVNLILSLNNISKKIQNQFLDYFKNNELGLEKPYIKNIININFENYTNCLK